MGRKALSKEITAQEMLRLREEELLSNYEIAAKLDISYPTVLRYIGKQNGRSKKPDQAQNKPVVRNTKVWDEARSLTRLKADWRAYDMDVYNANVTLYAGQGNRIRLELDDIHRMINELTYVEEVITKFQNERKTKNAI